MGPSGKGFWWNRGIGVGSSIPWWNNSRIGLEWSWDTSSRFPSPISVPIEQSWEPGNNRTPWKDLYLIPSWYRPFAWKRATGKHIYILSMNSLLHTTYVLHLKWPTIARLPFSDFIWKSLLIYYNRNTKAPMGCQSNQAALSSSWPDLYFLCFWSCQRLGSESTPPMGDVVSVGI